MLIFIHINVFVLLNKSHITYMINDLYRLKLFIDRHPLLLQCPGYVGLLLQLRQDISNCHAY